MNVDKLADASSCVHFSRIQPVIMAHPFSLEEYTSLVFNCWVWNLDFFLCYSLCISGAIQRDWKVLHTHSHI